MESSSPEPFWRILYGDFLNFFAQENHRFWTRFQTSLFINGGLIVAFSTLLGFLGEQNEPTELSKYSLFWIASMGVVFSALWIIIIRTSRSWQNYWFDQLKKLEEKHEQDIEIKIVPPPCTIRGSVTQASYGYPISFLIFWIFASLWTIFSIFKLLSF